MFLQVLQKKQYLLESFHKMKRQRTTLINCLVLIITTTSIVAGCETDLSPYLSRTCSNGLLRSKHMTLNQYFIKIAHYNSDYILYIHIMHQRSRVESGGAPSYNNSCTYININVNAIRKTQLKC